MLYEVITQLLLVPPDGRQTRFGLAAHDDASRRRPRVQLGHVAHQRAGVDLVRPPAMKTMPPWPVTACSSAAAKRSISGWRLTKSGGSAPGAPSSRKAGRLGGVA